MKIAVYGKGEIHGFSNTMDILDLVTRPLRRNDVLDNLDRKNFVR